MPVCATQFIKGLTWHMLAEGQAVANTCQPLCNSVSDCVIHWSKYILQKKLAKEVFCTAKFIVAM